MKEETEAWRVSTHREGEPSEMQGTGVVDEIVVGDWFHLECMDDGVWWIRLGDARLRVSRDKDSTVIVDVERGAYGEVLGTTGVYEPPGLKDDS